MADENVGVYPPDVSTLAGRVRILVGDTEPKPLTVPEDGLGSYAWYSDEELEALGEMNGLNPKRVAIWVLSIVPLNQAMLLKKWTTDDLQVDGPAIIMGMEATLKRLSAEVDREGLADGTNEYFEIFGGFPNQLPRMIVPTVPGDWMFL